MNKTSIKLTKETVGIKVDGGLLLSFNFNNIF